MEAYEPTGVLSGNVFTLEELLAMRDKVKAIFTQDLGQQVVQWGAQGNSGINRFNLSPSEMLAEIALALFELDPVTYPLSSAPDRATASFR
jgi:hypothetical protein